MVQNQQFHDRDSGTPDSKWKDLYRIGCLACAAFPVLIAGAVIAFFIWPYTPGIATVEEIFAALQTDRLGGLLSLDLSVPIMLPVMVLEYLGLDAALKRVNESYALI